MQRITRECKVNPGESHAELDHLISDYQRVLQPVGPVETTLLRTAVRAEWRQRRYVRMQTACLAERTAALGRTENSAVTDAARDEAADRVFSKIARRYETAGRQ